MTRKAEREAGMRDSGGGADRGLDWLNLLLSAAGAAYGAFIPVYLTGQAWTQTHIGLTLTIGTVTAVLCLLPAGLLIDALSRWRRRILAIAIMAGSGAPFLLAALPRPLPVTLAVVLQAAAASLFTPAIAAISLSLSGHAGLSQRLGRNARYGSIGAGLGAAMLGVCGIWGGERGVFVIAAVFTLAALVALYRVGADRPLVARDASQPGSAPPDSAPPDSAEPNDSFGESWKASRRLLRDRRVLVFGLAVALFQVASIAVVQLAAVEVTRRLGSRAGIVIAAFVIVPQLVVIWIAPMISQFADRFGRRTVLLAGFATVPVRNTLFAAIPSPVGQVPVQALEGVGGTIFGVMLPLIAADLTRGGCFFTSCMALFGLASSLGVAISTSLAGWIADRVGRPVTYLVLAAIGIIALAIIWRWMPETRERDEPEPGQAPRQAPRQA